MTSWDDLRFVLAVARAGTLSGAARVLGVNHSTVFRRVAAAEAALGVRLFERMGSGYAATPAGEDLARTAGHVEEEILALDRRLAGRDIRLSGTVRLTAADSVAQALLAPWLAPFADRYPGIQVELAVGNSFFNLSRREADIAIRPAGAIQDLMVGRRLATVAWRLYSAPSYLARFGEPADADWAAHRFVGPDESLAGVPAALWLDRHVPPSAVVLRVNSVAAMAAAVVAGAGLAVLPCFLAEREAGLARLAVALEGAEDALWMMTHPDLRRTARVRALLDFLAEAATRDRALIEGRRGRS